MTQIANLVTYKQEFTPAVVGMGATEICWTDRHAFTVIKVSESGKTATIQQDTAIRTDKNGTSENQTYRFERNSNGIVREAFLTASGWRIGGKKGTKIIMNHRDEYYDYDF